MGCSSWPSTALVLLLCTTARANYNVSTIVLGTALRFEFEPSYYPMSCALQLALDDLNANTTLLPDTQIIYRALQTNCSTVAAADSTLRGSAPYWSNYTQGSAGPMVGVVGAGCSGASTAAAHIAEYAMIPFVSYAATSPILSQRKEFPVR